MKKFTFNSTPTGDGQPSPYFKDKTAFVFFFDKIVKTGFFILCNNFYVFRHRSNYILNGFTLQPAIKRCMFYLCFEIFIQFPTE